MTSPVWQATVTDDTGDVLPGAQIDVVIESTGTDATLFSNRAGTTSLSNPFFADSEGFAQFYTEPGAYRITATASGGGTTRTWRYVSLFDFDANVGTAAGEVPLNSTLVPKAGGTFTGDIEAPKITASTGILFGTDTAAANTLDDYEEGTWTPVNAGWGSLTILKANYTKIGDTVRLFAQVTGDSTDAVTIDEDSEISGLPFSVDSSATKGLGGVVQYYSNHGLSKNALGDTLSDLNQSKINSEIILVRGSFTFADCASITIAITHRTTS